LGGSYIGKAPFSSDDQSKPTVFFGRMHEQALTAEAVFPTATMHPEIPTVVTGLAMSPSGDTLYAGGAFEAAFPLVDASDVEGYGQGFVAALDPMTLARRWGHGLVTPASNGDTPQSYVSGVATGAGDGSGVAIAGQLYGGKLTVGSKSVHASLWTAFAETFDGATGAARTVIALDTLSDPTEEWRIGADGARLCASGLGSTYFASLLASDASSEQRIPLPSGEQPVPGDVVAIPGSNDWLIGASLWIPGNHHELALVRLGADRSYSVVWHGKVPSRLQAFSRIRFEPDGRLLGLGFFKGDLDFGGLVGPIAATSTDVGDLFLAEFAPDLKTVNWALDLGEASDVLYGGIGVTADGAYAYVVVPFSHELSLEGKKIPALRHSDSALLKLRLK
ncbi:MAG TPA: hypothetical protein VHB21_18245, partial [Minicystis sp.]|nr:hypothetical protein [Minicystis sp.]